MGQMAGANVWPAVAGFCVTGVGLPLLGVAALGISRSGGLFELGSRVGKPLLDVFHLPALPDHRAVLSPSPAAPPPPSPWDWSRCCRRAAIRGSACWRSPPPSSPRRCSSRSARARSSSGSARCSTPASCCSSAFWSSWRCSAQAPPSARSSGGRLRRPAFLHRLPRGLQHHGRAGKPCLRHRWSQVIRDLGVTEPDAVAGSTVRAGIFSCLLMAAIYVAVTIVGVQSRGLFETSRKRRHRPRADRAALPRLRRPSDPRRDRDARLPLRPPWASSPAARRPSRASSPRARPTASGR